MRKSIVLLTATMLLCLGQTVQAQTERLRVGERSEGMNGFKRINVKEDFTSNGFQWFNDAQLLCAGDKVKSNAMTIGWGGIGTLWGRPTVTVYVAEKRYTKEFMDKSEYVGEVVGAWVKE